MSKPIMPEPVAYSVLDKRTGKHWYTHESTSRAQHQANIYSHRESDGSPSMIVIGVITTEQAEAYANARVRAALEAAMVAVTDHNITGREWVMNSLWANISAEAAVRISALIAKELE